MTAEETPIIDQLLDAAELRARTSGYDGFSFRDLASDVGIKSSSVHYHFPTKAHIGQALMRRYQARTFDLLGEAGQVDAIVAISRLVEIFRASALSKKMCLCGAFGATHGGIPEEVRDIVKSYQESLLSWIECVDRNSELPMRPVSILSLLEGALLMSIAADDVRVFDDAVSSLIDKETNRVWHVKSNIEVAGADC